MISYILETISNFTLNMISWGGYAGVFFLMALESTNIPIPSEVIMPFSGFLAASGNFNFWFVILIGAFGNLTGSLFSYWLGYLVRHNILHWNGGGVNMEVERAKKWLDKWGDFAIFFSRILPVVRTFISFPLGILKAKSILRFSLLTFFGSFIWSALLAYLGFIFGKNWQVLHVYFRKFDYLIVAVFIIGSIWFIWEHYIKKNNQ